MINSFSSDVLHISVSLGCRLRRL